MTSRTPRETRLRLVPPAPSERVAGPRPSAPARRAPKPPGDVPGQQRLAAQARAQLADAVRLARWAARTGVSPESAAREAAGALGMTVSQVRDHWGRARLAGLVEHGGAGARGEGAHGGATGGGHTQGRVRAGWRLRAWERDDSAVLRGWVALFDAWSLARPAPPGADPGAVADVVAAVPQLLSVMRLTGGPVTAAGLVELLRQRISELRAERPGPAETGGSGEPVKPADEQELELLLGWALDALASLGALTLHARGARPVRARLTELGGWAVWTKLEHICIAAQSPAGNIEQSAVAMLRGCASLTPGPARDEYRAWLAARPTGPAVQELLDAARGEDALVRGLAFEALRVVGAPALEAVRAVVTEPLLRPYALLWLADHEEDGDARGQAAADEVLTRAEATWLWVDTASAAQEHGSEGMLLDHLESAPQPTITELVDEVRTCGHPRTVQVLLALAAAYPDPALAKRVRRAAFQLHTGGA
ncbi:hypothetical protein [Streptomyces sp. 7-21]|uniref:hypothetical protein n=1 Tax=Streptomyces sp. 7-21 TaxID=2802283 RepID=UPI00191DF041|nr:hypothetical protein [Streptomyces sp. 7-21]MBL1069157.1 hypothetical protein [Streptomyces sp. 7-21]